MKHGSRFFSLEVIFVKNPVHQKPTPRKEKFQNILGKGRSREPVAKKIEPAKISGTLSTLTFNER